MSFFDDEEDFFEDEELGFWGGEVLDFENYLVLSKRYNKAEVNDMDVEALNDTWKSLKKDYEQYCEENDYTSSEPYWVEQESVKLKHVGQTWEGERIYEIGGNFFVTKSGEVLTGDRDYYKSTIYHSAYGSRTPYHTKEEVASSIFTHYDIRTMNRRIDMINQRIDGKRFYLFERDDTDIAFVFYKGYGFMIDEEDDLIIMDDDLEPEDIEEDIRDDVIAIFRAFMVEDVQFFHIDEIDPDIEDEDFDPPSPTNKRLAGYFGKSERTVANWKKENPRLYGAIKRDFEENALVKNNL